MSKKGYTFWYTESYTNKGYFEAESKEEALALLAKVASGDTCLDELPEWWYKDKGYELDMSTDTLEELEG